MPTIDIILLVLWGFGTLRGWKQGLVRQVVSLAGLLVGLIFARLCYRVLGDVLTPYLNGYSTLADILAFALIWLIVPIVLSLMGEVLSTVLDKLFVLGVLNRLLGSVIGFFKWMFVLGSLVWILNLLGALSTATMQESLLCQPLQKVPERVVKAFASAGKSDAKDDTSEDTREQLESSMVI